MMRRLLCSLVVPLLGAGCVVQAGVDGTESARADAIIHGTVCDEMTNESAIAILIDATISFGSFGTQPIRAVMCTGTLIAPDTVMTAAHCTDPSLLTQGFGEVQNAKYYVSGTADLSALAQQSQTLPALPADAIEVTEAIHHEEFNINNFQSVNGPGDFKDIALMFLSAPMNRVPMHVVTEAEAAALMAVGTNLVVVGWGQQQPSANQFETPPAGTVGIKVCADALLNEVGASEFQVGSDVNSARKCHGDSGGPSYARNAGGDLRVVGVTSHAYDNTDCQKGGLDTRVDVYRGWLDGKMTERCTAGTRAWCGVPGIPPPDFMFNREADGGIFAGYDAGPATSSSSSGGSSSGGGSAGDGASDDKGGAPALPGCSQAGGDAVLSAGMLLALGVLLRRRRA